MVGPTASPVSPAAAARPARQAALQVPARGRGEEVRLARTPEVAAGASREPARPIAGAFWAARPVGAGRPRHRWVAIYEQAMADWLSREPLALEAARAAAVRVAA